MPKYSSSNSGYLTFAHALADIADRISLERFRASGQSGITKADGTLVCDTDIEVEDALRMAIHNEYSDDSVLGEERGATGSGRRCWLIDGIDGTKHFLSGGTDWSTLIACTDGTETDVAMISRPLTGIRAWAGAGNGAWLSRDRLQERTRLQVSGRDDDARSYIPEMIVDRDASRRAERCGGVISVTKRQNHAALQVAQGDYEAALFIGVHPWDTAAPALIVEEAGGRFSDCNGGRNIFDPNVVFSNAIVHERILAAWHGRDRRSE